MDAENGKVTIRGGMGTITVAEAFKIIDEVNAVIFFDMALNGLRDAGIALDESEITRKRKAAFRREVKQIRDTADECIRKLMEIYRQEYGEELQAEEV